MYFWDGMGLGRQCVILLLRVPLLVWNWYVLEKKVSTLDHSSKAKTR
jgi:hypothetical protein